MNTAEQIVEHVLAGNYANAIDEVKSELTIRVKSIVESHTPLILSQYGMNIVESDKKPKTEGELVCPECDAESEDGEICQACLDKKEKEKEQEDEACKGKKV